MNLKMIRSGIVAAALAVAPFAAQAADLPAPSYKAPAYVSPSVFSWSGFYVGLNLGYAFGNSHWDNPIVDLTPRGAVVGGTVGYNLQTGSWVWGLEGDLDYSAAKGSAACGGGTCETAMTWLGTARGRLGYGGWSNWLPYVTGGLAFGGVKATNSAVGSTSTTRLGWTIGAGLEYALFSNWSVKAEYLYVDLGKFNCTNCSATGVDNVTYHTSIVRAGLNYRF
jgi:outer membrane immunogenic protein